MTIAQTGEPIPHKPLRVWPGVVAVTLAWLARFVVPVVMPEALAYGVLGGLVGGLVVVIWWAFFSRAPRFERWGALVLMVAALGATSRVIHKSIATGMMGFMFPMYAIPVLSLAFVAWAVASRRLSDGPRRATMVATILLACGGWVLLRTNGISGSASSDFAWRWSETAEERLLAHASDRPAAPAPVPAPVQTPAERPIAKAGNEPKALPPASAAVKAPVEQPLARADSGTAAVREPVTAATSPGAEWPGFRGPHRNSIIPGVRIDTDWSHSPPVKMWRQPVGPGWSSFAVRNDLLYTQEQRGSDEVVACYNLSRGEPVWSHRDAARFWESNAGAGPRATPTLNSGRVYTFGATGIVNALDARNGAAVWSRNAVSDAGKKVPGWGFASSPLVVDDLVIVAAAGKLVAYDLATGAPRWLGPDGGDSYSSPHLVTIGGVTQILLVSALGATSVAPADGKLLWKHSWPSDTRIMQPAVTADGDVLMTAGDALGGTGIRRIAVTQGPDGWTTVERWMSSGLKPNFNDFVIHNGHVYGFDGGILACIDLKDGKRSWKGGRYGHGQLVLLPDQDLLLVLSEEGELALVAAAADQFRELARIPAIEGKTWNHPVLAGDVLLVRNSEEMAAFRVAMMHR